MGCCATRRPYELSESKGKSATVYTYTVTLKVKETDTAGQLIGQDDVVIRMNHPLKTKSLFYTLQDYSVQTAYCVLPGLDPRQSEDKDCQDNLFITHGKDYLLAVLFDGHGSLGRQVVEACATFMTQKYSSVVDLVRARQSSPRATLERLVEDCDEYIIQRSCIDASLSGATAVLVMITATHIYSACLGDSRGVLGCVPGSGESMRSEVPEQSKGPFNRPCLPGRTVVPLALTLDQKPNHEEELQRIKQAGGVVQKITDSAGHKLGPYRVWKPGTTLPGLAMSRSIGDSLAKSVGVIGTPVVQQFTFDLSRDLFAVVASDGVW
jgi:serine/threonine protein phosphatase PrpC